MCSSCKKEEKKHLFLSLTHLRLINILAYILLWYSLTIHIKTHLKHILPIFQTKTISPFQHFHSIQLDNCDVRAKRSHPAIIYIILPLCARLAPDARDDDDDDASTHNYICSQKQTKWYSIYNCEFIWVAPNPNIRSDTKNQTLRDWHGMYVCDVFLSQVWCLVKRKLNY